MSLVYGTLYGTTNDDDLVVHYDPQGSDEIYYATIHGGDGNDSIKMDSSFPLNITYAFYGEGGNDTLDAITYSARAILDGGDGDDTVCVRGSDQSADGGDGYDTLIGGAESSIVLNAAKIKNFEEFDITGWTYIKNFDLGSFQKISLVGEDAHLIFSHAVNMDDYFIETNGHGLTLDGSPDNDRFDMSSYSSEFNIFGGEGNDIIVAGGGVLWARGGPGNDYIEGSDKKDRLSGGEDGDGGGTDTVLGLGGNDVIIFNQGKGVLDGGEGEDTLTFDPSNDYTKSLANVDIKNIEILDLATWDLRIILGTADLSAVKQLKGRGELVMNAGSLFTEVTIHKGSDITILGSQNDDTITFSGRNAGLIFHGRDGDDIIRSHNAAAYLRGDDGNDRLVGGNGLNRVYGGNGDDVIKVGDGNDYLNSGSGEDKILAGDGKDDIRLTIATDHDVKTVNAGADNDTITVDAVAVSGYGKIDGGEGEDTLYASGDLSGHRIENIERLQLRGKLTADADTFNSFETILAKSHTVFFDTNFNLALSSGGTFTWHDGSKVQSASLSGSDQRDTIDFSAAKNGWSIDGGGGDDIITGTRFADHLRGGQGNDTFVFGDHSGYDDIADYTHIKGETDVIDLSQSDIINNVADLKKHSEWDGNELDLIFGHTQIFITYQASEKLPIEFIL
jgi:Ca2+-binding RTX toxin-like protein